MDDHMTYEEPGAIIAARREELGLTQAEVAARLGYGHAGFISMMERGTSRVPLERVFDVARALELDPTWFLERMLRDRAETLPLADHLFGPGGPLHGASPAIAPSPERAERGREAARSAGAAGAAGAGGLGEELEAERAGGVRPGAAPRPGAGQPGGGEAMVRAPAGARGAPARPASTVQPPALPVPLSWSFEIEGRIRLALRPEVDHQVR